MKINLTYIILFILLITSCTSQNQEDSVNSAVISKNKHSQFINQAFDKVLNKDELPDESIKPIILSLDSIHTTNDILLAKKELIKASYNKKIGNLELSKYYYLKSLEHVDSNNILADYAFIGLGTVNRHIGNFPEALLNYQKSIVNNTYRKDNTRLAGTYASLAQLYFDKEDSIKSKEYILKVFSILKDKKQDRPYLIALHTLANIEGKNGNFKKAMELDEEGLKLTDNNDESRTTFQDNLARCYLYFEKDYEKAKFLFYENLKIDKKLNKPNWIADSYINLSEVAIAEKKFIDAKLYVDSAISILEKRKNYINTIKAYTALTNIYITQKDFRNAYQTQLNFLSNYKKSINEKKEKAFVAYNVIYETEKKEKQIAQAQVKAKQKNIVLIILGASILIGLFIFRNYKAKVRHQAKKLSLENELLKEQAHSLMQHQRLQISRDLHDSLGAQLTFINHTLDSLKNISSNLDNAINQKINTLSTFSENTIQELKNTLWVLNTAEINIQDLKFKILNFINNASEAKEDINFKLNFDVSSNLILSSKQAINLFRVVQEIINNAIKYAQATEIKIEVKQTENKLFITLADNGKGFDYKKEKDKSFGLKNIESRINEINGTSTIDTSIGNGAIYNIEIVL